MLENIVVATERDGLQTFDMEYGLMISQSDFIFVSVDRTCKFFKMTMVHCYAASCIMLLNYYADTSHSELVMTDNNSIRQNTICSLTAI